MNIIRACIIFMMAVTTFACSNSSVVLEGLYATSNKIPQADFGPEKLFDGNQSTIWATMPGAGPDEGVMMQFDEPVYLSRIQLKSTDSSEYEKITYYQVYINGAVSSVRSVEAPVSIERNVKTLYVRIKEVASMDKDAQGIQYKSNKPISLSEIVLFGKGGKELTIIPPAVIKGKITASSMLEPEIAYHSDFLFDSRKDFGWADGNVKKTGTGESLTFSFTDNVTIQKIKIWNGYQRSDKHFTANERVKTFTFAITGKKADEYTIPDAQYPTVIDLKESLTGTSFTLTVKDIYQGDSYKDLVISELRFFDGKKWFIVDSSGMEKRKKAVVAMGNQSLKKMLDKRIFISKSNPDNEQVTQSIILRSNGSFILWKSDVTSASEQTVYADGNWQLKGNNQIRIFGRLHTIKIYDEEEDYDPYSGADEEEAETPEDVDKVQIFQDMVALSPNSIKSSKGLFEDFVY